jgi:hypothetical protein
MKLNELWLHINPIKGTIPDTLSKLSNHLTDLRLYDTNLEGTIPESIWDLTDLWRLDLHQSNFTGTISSKISNLLSLSVFRISDNQFSGTLPSELASLDELHTVWVAGNKFNGSVPTALCENKGLDGLNFIEADCLPDPLTGVALVECECCDSCCHAAVDECKLQSRI